MLKIRKLKPSDKPRVLEIVKDLWEGDDYMPLVFDSWIKDKKGEFIGAVDEKGKLIGFEKLTMVSDNDAWIEGLRKDMKSNVKGVGVFLSNYFIEKLKKNKKIKTIRFSTYFRNIESISLFGKIGFKIIEKKNNKFSVLPKIKSVPEYKGNRAEILKDEKQILKYFKKSASIKYLKNGINLSWVIHPITDELIKKEFIKKGQCLGIVVDGKIKAMCLYMVREKDDLYISYFSAENDKYAKELYQKVKQIAYKEKRKYISTIIPLKDKDWNRTFKQFRFRSWEREKDFMLFDLPVK